MGQPTLRDLLIDSFLRRSEKRAITFFRGKRAETELSYDQLNQDTNRLANWFLDSGVQKGDRIVLFLEKSLIFVVAHIALQKLGAVSVPLNPGFKKGEMEYFLYDADPKLVLAEKTRTSTLKEINPGTICFSIDTGNPYQTIGFFQTETDVLPEASISPDDAGLIVYTSGTTGMPKGALLTQRNLAFDATNIIDTWEIVSSDVLCHALPLFHVHGLCFALHTTLGAGAAVVMVDRFSPGTVLERLRQKEGTHVCSLFMAVPAMYNAMLSHLQGKPLDGNHIRLWASGSAPLLSKDFQRIRRLFGKAPVEREGMSETGMNFSNPIRGKKKPGAIGLPMPGLNVRIVDPNTGVDAAGGQTGEIWLKGPAVTPGYWRKPKETARAFEGGWFKTGDLGYRDKEGYYFLTDRQKNIIISGGENISPYEVETVINRLEGVAAVSVVGIPDEKWGEKVVAAVVLKPGERIDRDAVAAICRKHLHDWKCPREIVFIDDLPKNTMGKIQKAEVKKRFTT